MPEPIRVLVVDDHAVVREGLRTFLRLQEGIDVVGEAADGVEAVAEAAPARARRRADGPRDAEARRRRARCSRSASARSETRVIVLTSFGDDEKLLPAVRAGAAGYLLKSAAPQEVVRAIRAAHEGDAVIDPKAAGRLLEALARAPAAPQPLTPRERDVLDVRLPRACRTSRSRASSASSEKTVKTHVGHILAKLGVTDRTQAALLAVREGLADC